VAALAGAAVFGAVAGLAVFAGAAVFGAVAGVAVFADAGAIVLDAAVFGGLAGAAGFAAAEPGDGGSASFLLWIALDWSVPAGLLV